MFFETIAKFDTFQFFVGYLTTTTIGIMTNNAQVRRAGTGYSKGAVSRVNSPIILTIGPSCMGPLVSQNSTWLVLHIYFWWWLVSTSRTTKPSVTITTKFRELLWIMRKVTGRLKGSPSKRPFKNYIAASFLRLESKWNMGISTSLP